MILLRGSPGTPVSYTCPLTLLVPPGLFSTCTNTTETQTEQLYFTSVHEVLTSMAISRLDPQMVYLSLLSRRADSFTVPGIFGPFREHFCRTTFQRNSVPTSNLNGASLPPYTKSILWKSTQFSFKVGNFICSFRKLLFLSYCIGEIICNHYHHFTRQTGWRHYHSC